MFQSSKDKPENLETLKPSPESFVPPQAHSQKTENPIPEPLISPYFSVEALQKQPAQGSSAIKPFSNMFDSSSFFMEYVTPEFIIPTQEGQAKDEFPIDFSAQKYYETIASGFDSTYVPGGFLCEDGYSFIPYPNPPPEMASYNNIPYPPDYDYFVQDGGKIEVKTEDGNGKGDNNYILDLSKTEENDIDACSAAKFNEVSSRICDELAKII